jgi:hypothetical protein
MTRAEFWAKKLLQAEVLNIPIDDLLNAMALEWVSSETVDNWSTAKFADGSIIKVKPVMTENGRKGWVETE